MSTPITDLTPEEITRELDLKPFQGRQVFQWLHRKRVFDFDAMTNLSKDLRQTLKTACVAPQLHVLHVDVSERSGTRKTLFQLRDGETVESVFLIDKERITLCVSSQVGCAFNCAFCATGLSGFRRDLSAGEIVEQALHLLPVGHDEARTPNIVYMGMGEPFRNYDAVVKSIRLLTAKEGLNIGVRKITVSTVGDVPGILRFAHEGWQVRLAVSLHAANDRLRDRLVPMNRKYPLAKLMEAIEQYIATTNRQISFEWVLLAGVNDSEADAHELADLIGGMKASVNLIAYNAVEGVRFAPPSMAVCEQFRDALLARDLQCTLRVERGQDIAAACGQLRRRKEEG